MYSEFSKVYDNMMSYVDYELWVELIEKYIPKEKYSNILELGCGTGEVTLRLYRDGYNVEGIDLSEEMLTLAKNKTDMFGYPIEFYHMNMLDIEYQDEFDGIISIFDTVNHLKSLEELDRLFEAVSKSLKRKGIFFFDVVSREMLNEMFVDGIFADDREDLTILWEHYYEEETRLDHITTSFFIRKEGNIYERIDEHHEKMIFTHDGILESASKYGMKVLKVEENDEIAGVRSIYILEKED